MRSLNGVHPRMETAGLTDLGLVRSKNEDSLFFTDVPGPNAFGAASFGIYLIADGMGGHRGGEVASHTAMQTISNALLERLQAGIAPPSASEMLRQAIDLAHMEILRIARGSPELRSMGTTATVGLRLDYDLYLGHVGDSRAYLVREGQIRQLTEDHSVVARLIRRREITPHEGRTHPDKGKILRCLGVTRDVMVDTLVRDTRESKLCLQKGDALVLCSDGLTDWVSEVEILKCAATISESAGVCGELVSKANTRGGGDNISVIVVRVRS